MKQPINFKGDQVLEFNVCKRMTFDPGIDLMTFYGGGEGLNSRTNFLEERGNDMSQRGQPNLSFIFIFNFRI